MNMRECFLKLVKEHKWLKNENLQRERSSYYCSLNLGNLLSIIIAYE